MELIYSTTEKNLKLPWFFYETDNKELCCLFIHGLSASLVENPFADVLGKYLQRNWIAFLYSQNSWYAHVNDIKTTKINKNKWYYTQRIWAVYERFSDCIYDIDSWITTILQKWYKNIILIWHSSWCNKVLYYYHRKKIDNIIWIALLSAPDFVGLFKLEKYVPNYKELLEEAKEYVKQNNPQKILSTKIWDYHYLSAQTFLDLAVDESPADNIPLLRNPDNFEELNNIQIPILAVYGEYDDIIIRSLEQDLDLIKQKCKSCMHFSKAVIPDAAHNYDLAPEKLAETIRDRISRDIW